MEARDALKKTGKAYKEERCVNHYAMDDGAGRLCWYEKINNEFKGAVLLWDITDNNWQPYPDKVEIRPEKAGEVWELDTNQDWGTYIVTGYPSSNRLRMISIASGEMNNKVDIGYIIHNKNGWKLLYSPDKEVMKQLKEMEDENVEMVRVDGVLLNAAIIDAPFSATIGYWNLFISYLRSRGLKIVEIPKDKE